MKRNRERDIGINNYDMESSMIGINDLTEAEWNFYKKIDDAFFPLRTEPIVGFDGRKTTPYIQSIRIYASTGKWNCCYLITRKMLDSCKNMKEMVKITINQLNHHIEKTMFEDRYKNALKEKTGTKYDYMVDTAMPKNEILITVHPLSYKYFLLDKEKSLANIFGVIAEKKIRKEK